MTAQGELVAILTCPKCEARFSPSAGDRRIRCPACGASGRPTE